MDGKMLAAEQAVKLIRDGMTVGLGSGSTASLAIQKIGERVREGLNIRTVATSRKTEKLARELSIPVYDPSEIENIDIALDGADEVDTKGNLLKGGGGSLLREKVIAFASKGFHVMVDQSKLVDRLGRSALPVEIVPFAAALTLKHLRALGCDPHIRQSMGENFITDNGNLIADCRFQQIDEPAWLDVKIKMIPGVIETGLFSSKIVTSVFVGSNNGGVREIFISDPNA
ncbi:MAG: ribose-5-phosphate isomerase RpiA [Chryseosolibacter sp.]